MAVLAGEAAEESETEMTPEGLLKRDAHRFRICALVLAIALVLPFALRANLPPEGESCPPGMETLYCQRCWWIFCTTYIVCATPGSGGCGS